MTRTSVCSRRIRSRHITITVPKSTLTLHLREQALLILYIRTSTPVSRVQVCRVTSQSSQAEDSREREDDSRKRGKGPKKQAAKYDSFEPEEERYLANLWVSYHERLESKDAREYWSKIVDELNAKYNHSRNVEKCKRKMKYLVDKYKERKDWDQKQSGGSIWKSPHYDEIDAVLGVRDVVTFSNVVGAGSESSSKSNATSQEESSPGTPSPAPANTSTSSSDSEKQSKRMGKKRKTPQTLDPENETGKVMKTVTDQGERIASVMKKMQRLRRNKWT